MTKLGKALSIFLGIAIIGAVAAVIYAVSSSAPGSAFTEFYLLGPGGQAADYPVRLKAGQEGTVILGIVSHEREINTYRVAVNAGGSVINELDPIVLGPGEKSEQPASFVPDTPGVGQKVTFLLYKGGQPEASNSLYLFVDITP